MKRKLLAAVLVAAMAVSLAACGESGSDSEAGSGSSDSSQASSEDSGSGSDATFEAEADENGNYVVNGSFEEADFTGWNVTNIDGVTEELDIYTRETDCYDGVQSLHFYSGSNDINFTAEQTLTGLEEGSYKLTGYIQGDTAGDEDASIYFYAIIDGETYTVDTTLNGYVNWNTAELGDLEVTNGEITIGVSVTIAPGGWGTIDNITLVKE